MLFKCDCCGGDTLLIYMLSMYGQTAKGVKDDGEYCEVCFDRKFEEDTNDKDK